MKLGLTLRPLKRGNLRGESVETEEATMRERRKEEAAMWDAEGFKYKASSISSKDPPFLYCSLELRAYFCFCEECIIVFVFVIVRKLSFFDIRKCV